MNSNINIKGLIDKENLLEKNLNLNSINIIKGSINLKKPIKDFFEIEIKHELTEKNILPFNDNNLIILKGILYLNIIASNEDNLGIFLKESYPFLINNSALFPLKNTELFLIDALFFLKDQKELSFTIVSIIDTYSKTNTISINNIKDENITFNFDSEFI